MTIKIHKDPTTKKSQFTGAVRQNWTDTKEILNPLLMIAYRERPGVLYPTAPVRALVVAAAAAARRIMRNALLQMDRVVFFRRKEGQAFTNTMNYHFGLAAGRSPGLPSSNVVDKSFGVRDLGATDRRWALNKVRQGMLSLSFHINTGVYLIDCDNDYRSLKSGMNQGAGASPVGRDATGAATGSLEEGYCTFASGGGFNKGMLSGWKNGEIHVAMHVMQELGYSDDAFARVIIHEAAHKYLGVTDKLYAHQGGYDALPFTDCIDNADSYAWAALSLDAGHLIKGLHSTDSAAFTTPIP